MAKYVKAIISMASIIIIWNSVNQWHGEIIENGINGGIMKIMAAWRKRKYQNENNGKINGIEII
jgi:hypothetical protein